MTIARRHAIASAPPNVALYHARQTSNIPTPLPGTGRTFDASVEIGPVGVDGRPRRRGSESVARALAASDVGTWEWYAADEILRCDAVAASMLGVPRARGDRGGSFASLLDRIHPEDQRRIGSMIDTLRRQGGLFVTQFRTIPEADEVRWILARGRFNRTAEAAVYEARGIVIDVTASSQDGFLDEAAFCAADASAGGIDRVAELALMLFESAESSLHPHDFDRLKPLLDVLLHEIGRQLVGSPPIAHLDLIH
ncbi:PAS domain-containing protein [Methylobacterium sp. J-030]|uniref:PAS domain-containing protein n=1 Tax=Methylobacterium sp. J-030 TaxID=2836627 RepID=UPI001FB877CA|nr:PAS domain-containing protein [Methylobacterium sp. J-030]MCJ2070254.1 PAS domain-containing protein [Methylobacterium sp. J-030]